MKDKQDKQKQLSLAEFVKHAAENHIEFTLPEDNIQCKNVKMIWSIRNSESYINRL